jgi:hypothetical protein
MAFGVRIKGLVVGVLFICERLGLKDHGHNHDHGYTIVGTLGIIV